MFRDWAFFWRGTIERDRLYVVITFLFLSFLRKPSRPLSYPFCGKE
jgi:hypothetical protein